MSHKRPTEASWDSDDDLLDEELSGITAFPTTKVRDESDEELDEDALLGSDDEAPAYELQKKRAWSLTNSRPTNKKNAPGNLDPPTIKTARVPSGATHSDADVSMSLPQASQEVEDNDFVLESSQFDDLDDVSLNVENVGSSKESSESEEDDNEDVRGRFKSERSIAVVVPSVAAKPRTDIPDTLEISEEQQAVIDKFINTKTTRHRGRGNRRGMRFPGRGGQTFQNRFNHPAFPVNQSGPLPLFPQMFPIQSNLNSNLHRIPPLFPSLQSSAPPTQPSLARHNIVSGQQNQQNRSLIDPMAMDHAVNIRSKDSSYAEPFNQSDSLISDISRSIPHQSNELPSSSTSSAHASDIVTSNEVPTTTTSRRILINPHFKGSNVKMQPDPTPDMYPALARSLNYPNAPFTKGIPLMDFSQTARPVESHIGPRLHEPIQGFTDHNIATPPRIIGSPDHHRHPSLVNQPLSSQVDSFSTGPTHFQNTQDFFQKPRYPQPPHQNHFNVVNPINQRLPSVHSAPVQTINTISQNAAARMRNINNVTDQPRNITTSLKPLSKSSCSDTPILTGKNKNIKLASTVPTKRLSGDSNSYNIPVKMKRSSHSSAQLTSALKVVQTEAPEDEEMKKLNQKIEQQKKLREEIIRRKEQRRLMQAGQRRHDLIKKLSDQGLTLNDIEPQDAPTGEPNSHIIPRTAETQTKKPSISKKLQSRLNQSMEKRKQMAMIALGRNSASRARALAIRQNAPRMPPAPPFPNGATVFNAFLQMVQSGVVPGFDGPRSFRPNTPQPLLSFPNRPLSLHPGQVLQPPELGTYSFPNSPRFRPHSATAINVRPPMNNQPPLIRTSGPTPMLLNSFPDDTNMTQVQGKPFNDLPETVHRPPFATIGRESLQFRGMRNFSRPFPRGRGFMRQGFRPIVSAAPFRYPEQSFASVLEPGQQINYSQNLPMGQSGHFNDPTETSQPNIQRFTEKTHKQGFLNVKSVASSTNTTNRVVIKSANSSNTPVSSVQPHLLTSLNSNQIARNVVTGHPSSNDLKPTPVSQESVKKEKPYIPRIVFDKNDPMIQSGKTLKVISRSRTSQPASNAATPVSQLCSVRIDNLSLSTSQDSLRRMAMTVGPVQTVILNKNAGQAVVTFNSSSSAQAFVRKYNRQMLDLSHISLTLVSS